MKVNNLFLVGVAALSLGMTACNNEDVPQVNNPGEGTTFAGMYISAMKDVSTRAVNDNQEDYGGRTEDVYKRQGYRWASCGRILAIKPAR